MSATNNNNNNLISAVQTYETIAENINFVSNDGGNIIINIPVENSRQSSQLDDLLELFNLNEVKPYLTRAEITFESLKYLSKEDIKEAIPPIGLVHAFEKNCLFGEKYDIDDDTLSETIDNKVVSWLQNQSNTGTTLTPSSFSKSSSELDESVLLALQAFLSREFSNSDEVKDKWSKTFVLRQKELKATKSNYEFLSNWPFYSNSKSDELVSFTK